MVDAYRDGADVLEEAGVTQPQIATLPDEITELTDVSAGDARPSLPDLVAEIGIGDLPAFFKAAGQLTQSVELADAALGSGDTSTARGQGGTSGMTLVVRDGRRTVLLSLGRGPHEPLWPQP